MTGNGSTAASAADSPVTMAQFSTAIGVSSTSGQWGNAVLQIMDYSATDKHKTALARNNVAGIGVEASATRWANTAAITSVQVYVDTGSFAIGTTLSLYAIAS